MAEDWNKLKDKLGASADGPTPADWEAMQAKIAAQPSLKPAAASKLWLNWLVAGFLGLVLGVSAVYFWPTASGEQLGKEPTVDHSIQNQNSIQPSADENIDADHFTNASQADVVSNEERLNIQVGSPLNGDDDKPLIANEIDQASNTGLNDHVEQSLLESVAALAGESLESSQPRLSAENLQEMPARDLSSMAGLPQSATTSNQEPASTKPNINESAKESISDLAPAKPEIEAGEETELNLPRNTPEVASDSIAELNSFTNNENRAEDESSSRASENPSPFIAPSTGFKMEQLNISTAWNYDFRSPATSVYGLGLELQWNKQRQFFTAGLGYYRIEQGFEQTKYGSETRLDSTWKQEIETREVVEVRRIWVIDSFQAGHYVIDSIRRTVVDTNIILHVDTNQYQTKIVNQAVRPYYYAELPLLYGYRFGKGPWQAQLAGGVALQQAIAYSMDEDGSRSLFGMSALLQPAVSWRFSDKWSALARVQLRYPLHQDVALYEEPVLRYSFQLGVSFRW